MRNVKENLLVQFSVISFIIILAMAMVVSLMISGRLQHNIDHLSEHGVAMMTGAKIGQEDHISIPSITADVKRLQNTTLGVVGGGFLILYLSLVFIVARGSTTIQRQQDALSRVNKDLSGANEKLNEARDTLQLILNSAGEGIYGVDKKGTITFVNPAAARMVGWSSEELIGLPQHVLQKSVKDGGNGDNSSELLNDIDTGLLEEVFVQKDGTSFPVESIRSRMEEDGDVSGLVVTFQDVTDRKQAQERLTNSNKELEQFAYVASHDLQEPLRMVASYCQLLERRYKDQLDPDAQEFIEFAVDGAIRMQRLITDLLTYSRVTSQGESFEPTGPGDSFDSAVDNLKVSIDESGAVVTRETLPVVMAGGSQLTQLFQNLVGNAIKYKSEAAPEVHLSAERREEQVVFSVRDNGMGIDPEYFDRIFAIFERLHNQDEYPGTGIGLAVSRKIVERHGGRIWVESQQGKGSSFYFTAPALGHVPSSGVRVRHPVDVV